MIESKEKPIKNLKIEYNNETYEDIIYFSISNRDGEERVSFTNQPNKNTTVNINCKYSEIKMIKD